MSRNTSFAQGYLSPCNRHSSAGASLSQRKRRPKRRKKLDVARPLVCDFSLQQPFTKQGHRLKSMPLRDGFVDALRGIVKRFEEFFRGDLCLFELYLDAKFPSRRFKPVNKG